jgi:hypothetical protein
MFAPPRCEVLLTAARALRTARGAVDAADRGQVARPQLNHLDRVEDDSARQLKVRLANPANLDK